MNDWLEAMRDTAYVLSLLAGIPLLIVLGISVIACLPDMTTFNNEFGTGCKNWPTVTVVWNE